jgi:hypothetical protein
VPGADAYTVEYSVNGLDYVSLGRSNINFAVIEPVSFGPTWVRVNAVNDYDTSLWAVWEGNTAILPPEGLAVEASSYVGGTVTLTWSENENTDRYIVRVFQGGNEDVPVRIAETEDTTWTYTLGMGLLDGGPFRDLRLDVIAVNAMGSSDPEGVDVSDPAPAEIPIANIEGEPGTDSLTLTSVGDVEDDVTGFIVARGMYPNFTAEETIDQRTIEALPYTWSALEPDTTYYFRIAAKDTFFDATQKYDSLLYSESFEITTLAPEISDE